MLTSPIAMTISGVAYSLTKKNQDNFGSVWTDVTTTAGTEVKLTIRHSTEGKAAVSNSQLSLLRQRQYNRHIADLEVTVFDEDGFATVTQSYTHIRNLRGGAVAFAGDVAQALSGFVTTNADALVSGDN